MREKGIFSFSGNFEVAKTAPLDSKTLVPSYDDLIKKESWTDNKGSVWVYKGLTVTCQDRPGKLFQLANADYTKTSNWVEISGTGQQITDHIADKNNPHAVTKAQVGLGNVDNTSDVDKPISKATQAAIDAINANADAQGKELSAKLDKEIADRSNADKTLQANIDSEKNRASAKETELVNSISKEVSDRKTADSTLQANIDAEIAARKAADTNLQNAKVDKTITVNGHTLDKNVVVSKADVGLGNVTNDPQVKRAELGVASGVATLDATGKVPSSQLPSYVDDVLEADSKNKFPTTGETGKIYVTKDTNLTYRWSGTAYVEISPSLALGETSSTAYAGDKGKATTDKVNAHVANTSNPHGVTKAQVGLGNVDNTSDANKPVSTATQTALNNKVDKIAGKGLSTNDFDNTAKTRLNNIAGFGSFSHVNDDNAFIKSETDVKLSFDCSSADMAPANKAHHEVSIGAATSKTAGVMLAADKTKLDTYPANYSTVQTLISTTANTKVDKITGKGLSTNDYTTAEKNKLAGIADGANKYVYPYQHYTRNTAGDIGWDSSKDKLITGSAIAYWNGAYQGTSSNLQYCRRGEIAALSDIKTYSLPTANSTTLGGVKSSNTGTVAGRDYAVQVNADGTMKVNVPWTDNNTVYGLATTTANGLMSSADKAKLDGVDAKINAKLDASTAFRTVTGTSVKGSGDIVPRCTVNHGVQSLAASGGNNSAPHTGMLISSGMYMTCAYNTPNAPDTYGNVLNIAGAGDSQLFLGWRGDSATGSLYYRSHRDYNGSAWGPWRRLAYSDDIGALTDAEINEICK